MFFVIETFLGNKINYYTCTVSASFLCASFRYLQEYCPLGTGGGIYHFRDQIMRGNPRAFFVLHSDVCCDFPVVEMDNFQKTTAGQRGFVILGTEVPPYKLG